MGVSWEPASAKSGAHCRHGQVVAACLAAAALAGLPTWRLRIDVAVLRRIAAARARPAPAADAAPGAILKGSACDPSALARALADEDEDGERVVAGQRPFMGSAGQQERAGGGGAGKRGAAAQLQACLAAACLSGPPRVGQVRLPSHCPTIASQ